MKRVCIAIDPVLRVEYGKEVLWTWRTLLIGMGYLWEEVGFDHRGLDIAFLRPTGRAHPSAKIVILCEYEKWKNRSRLVLKSVQTTQRWKMPRFEGETRTFEAGRRIDGSFFCNRDLVFDIFWLLTGQEEASWPKNAHGHADLSRSGYYQFQALRPALASGISAQLQEVVQEMTGADPIPRWPPRKLAAACIGHDVDYPEVVRWLEPVRILNKHGRRGVAAAVAVLTGKRTHWHFQSWVNAEKALGYRSAFYFVLIKGSLFKYAAGTPNPFYDVRTEKFRTLFRYLGDEGFEIGIHASYRAYEDEKAFADEKQTLEEACGRPIAGCRHHYWHLNPDHPESTLSLHDKLGLEYDSSLIHDRYIGWRRGSTWPFFPFDTQNRREIRTLQLPTAWMDDQLFGFKADNPGERMEILSDLLARVIEQQGCFVADIHDYAYDEVLYPSWSETYLRVWRGLADRSDVWLCMPREAAGHWIRRRDQIIRDSSGLDEGISAP